MTDLVEVYLGQMSTQEDFANILHEKFPHIAVDDIQACKISSTWNFSRVQLPFENWVKLIEPVSDEDIMKNGGVKPPSQFMMTAPFYLQSDGCFFVIRDMNKIEREMTEEERERFKTDDFEQKMFTKQTVRQKRVVDGKVVNIQAPVEYGVKITVKTKEMQDFEAAAAAQATDNGEVDSEMKDESK